MSHHARALGVAGARVAVVRDDPAARLALMSRVLELVREGAPIYAWSFEPRHEWRRPRMPLAGRVRERVTRASG